jgi:ankyrin repeat protein
VFRNYIDIVKYLINVSDTTSSGHIIDCDMVDYLVDECNMNIIYRPDNSGKNALHIASQYGNIEIVKFLINYESYNKNNNNSNNNNHLIDAQDYHGYTPLHYAMDHDRIGIVQYFIEECQADITVTVENYGNMFDFAYRSSKYRTDIVVMLLHRLWKNNKPKKKGIE